jgi:hypothetical protein
MSKKQKDLIGKDYLLYRVVKDGYTVDCIKAEHLIHAAQIVKEKWGKYCKRSNLSVEQMD